MACTIDEGYAQHCGVMLCSLFRSNPGAPFRVFLISDGLSDLTREKLTRVAHEWQQQLVFKQIDARPFRSVRVSGHVPIAGCFRILIPRILPADVDRVLYLDSDVIVRGSVADLYAQPLDGYTHAAVVNPLCSAEHRKHPGTLGLPEGASYFNAGILLLDLHRWREEGIAERLVEYLQAAAEGLRWPHQDALNATLHDSWRRCHPTWNAQWVFFAGRSAAQLGMSDEDLLELRSNPRIVHYNGLPKPWSHSASHPFRDEYFECLALTPWKGYRPADRPPARLRLRLLAGRIAPIAVKKGYRRLMGRGVPAEE